MSSRLRVTVPVLLLLAGAGIPVLAGSSQAAGPGVVVSEVYGGGGNSGSTYRNDFVELQNTGASAVSLTGYAVQYASAAGSSWQVTPLSGSIAAGSHYLVQEAAGTGGTTDLPAPDATGSIALSASSGKVALTRDANALSCGATTGSCSAVASVADLIGYGAASDYETSAAPGISATTADSRTPAGSDTDNNATNFTAQAPNPQSGGSGGGGTPVAIHDIQGAAHVSPLAGRAVTGVPGVVTAVASNGFYFQDPNPDTNPATSEGVLVFTGQAPTVTAGDAVTVDGTVSEFRPGGNSDNLSTTEITAPTVSTISAGNPLPAPTTVGFAAGDRTPPTETISSVTGNVESSSHFDPATDGLDFYESLEGMRVELDDAVASGPTNRFGETSLLPDGGSGATGRTSRGGVAITSTDFNPERLVATGNIGVSVPTLNVGDSLPGATVGVLDYNFGEPMLRVTSVPARHDGGLARQSIPATPKGQLDFATFNVQNLAPSDPPTKFAGLGQAIVANLASPDLIAVEEIQDNSGATDDGTTSASNTWSMLIAAVRAAGGPQYSYRQIDPVNDQDGGQPGGNIRQGFLYRTDRGLTFVDTPGGTSTSSTTVVRTASGLHLSASPGRLQPTSNAFSSSRKPLVGEFTYKGATLFAIANHWNSKGGDDALFGRFQPPSLVSEAQRKAQAQVVNDFVTSAQQADPNANVMVLGDLNDYEFSTPLGTLTDGTGLVDLPATLPRAQRYTYDYEGNSEVLDHILLTQGLNARRVGYQVVHINSEFADQISDHDPQVVRLNAK